MGARQLVVQEAQLIMVSLPSNIVVYVEYDGFEVAGSGGQRSLLVLAPA
jgi:hypothetical protein